MPVHAQQLRNTLKEKGWPNHHIERTISTLHSASGLKSDSVKILDNLVFWGLLVIAVLGNFALSIVLIPVLVAFTNVALLITVAVLAIAFGFILDVVLREIEHLQKSHLIIPELFIPAIALINIYVITNLSNKLIVELNLVTHNPWIVSVVYITGFLIPHFILKMMRNTISSKPL